MAAVEFDKFIRTVMEQNPRWFEEVEPPVSEEDIAKVEAILGAPLPEEFKHFAMTFGGGYFGRINLSTLNAQSRWYLLSRPSVKVGGKRMLVISDDQTGGYCGFVLDGGAYQTRVTYVHPDDGNYTEDVASSFFAFIENDALRF